MFPKRKRENHQAYNGMNYLAYLLLGGYGILNILSKSATWEQPPVPGSYP